MPRSSGHAPEVLWKDEEFVLAREVWDGEPSPLLAVTPASAEPSPGTLARLQHAYTLREELDPAWAARPLRLDLHRGRLTLLVADPVFRRCDIARERRRRRGQRARLRLRPGSARS